MAEHSCITKDNAGFCYDEDRQKRQALPEAKLYFLRDDELDEQPSVVNGLMEFLATGTFEELEAMGFKLVGDFGWYDHAFYDCQLHEATFESRKAMKDA